MLAKSSNGVPACPAETKGLWMPSEGVGSWRTIGLSAGTRGLCQRLVLWMMRWEVGRLQMKAQDAGGLGAAKAGVPRLRLGRRLRSVSRRGSATVGAVWVSRTNVGDGVPKYTV